MPNNRASIVGVKFGVYNVRYKYSEFGDYKGGATNHADPYVTP